MLPTLPTRGRQRISVLLGSAGLAIMAGGNHAAGQSVEVILASGALDAASVSGRGTIGLTEQSFADGLLAQTSDGEVSQATTGAVEGSSVSVSDNELVATARGNRADTEGVLQGDDGRIGLLTAQLGTGQVQAEANDNSISALVETDDTAVGSSFDASGNEIRARSTVNEARTVFADSVSADLVDTLASDNTAITTARLEGGDLDTTILEVEGGSGVVANTQVLNGDAAGSRASASGNLIALNLRESQTSDATGSSFSIDNNDIRGSVTGNTAIAGTDLTVDTGFVGTGAVLNQQQIGDGSTEILLEARAEDNELQALAGTLTESAVSLSGNLIAAQAIGSIAADGPGAGTFLLVEANELVAPGGEAQVSFGTQDQLNLGGAFVLGSQQLILGDPDDSDIGANADRTEVTALANTVQDSSIDIIGNRIVASAGGNEGSSALRLAATSVNASAALGSEQRVQDTNIDARANDAIFGTTVEGGVAASSIAVEENRIDADAAGNVATNLLQVDSDTLLLRASPANRATVDGAPDESITSGGFVIGAVQEFSGDEVGLAALAGTTVSATVEGTGTRITDSRISVSDNAQSATASANAIENRLELSALSLGDADIGAFGRAATAAIASFQQVDADEIGATSELALSATRSGAATGPAIEGSTIAVDGNENRALASANEAVNVLTAASGADTVGNVSNAPTRARVNGGTFDVRGTTVISNTQQAEANSIGATADTDVLLQSVNGTNVSGTADSNLSASDNLTVARAAVNTARSEIEQTAGTSSGASAALRNIQSANVDDVDATAEGVFQLVLRGDVTGSTLALDGNRVFASSAGNTGTNRIDASALTIAPELPGSFDVFLARFDDDPATNAQLRALSQGLFAVLSDQTQSGQVEATAQTGSLLTVRDTNVDAGALQGSSASIDGSVARADAEANTTVNEIDVQAEAGAGDLTAALASRQTIEDDSAILATVETERPGAGAGDTTLQAAGGLQQSSATIDEGRFIANAAGNTAENRLSLAGNSIEGATDPDDFATLGARLDAGLGRVIARADGSLVNIQTVGDATTITAQADAESRLRTLEAGLDESRASISGNFARSDASGNRAGNLIDVTADTSATPAAAIGNVQVAQATIEAQTFLDSDINIAVNASGGTGLDGSSVTLDENFAVAVATANSADSVLRLAATTIEGISDTDDAAFVRLPGAGQDDAVARADTAIGSQQLAEGNVEAETENTLRSRTRGDIDASAVSVSGNIAQALASANVATSSLELEAAAGISGTAALAGEQTGNGDVTAVASLEARGRQEPEGGTAPVVRASSITLDDNLSISSARGNDAVNALVLAGSSVSGRGNDTSVRLDGGVVAGGNTGDNLLANAQSRTGEAQVESSATVEVLALRGEGVETRLENSRVSLSGNVADSTANANRASNTLVLNSDTTLAAGGGLVSSQSSDSVVSSDVRLSTLAGNDATGQIEASSVQVNENIGVARAVGNDVVNRIVASADTAIAGGGGTAEARLSSGGGVLNAEGQFAAASSQTNAGAVSAFASTEAQPSVASAINQGPVLNSSVQVSGNILVADAASNRAENRLTVSGRSASQDVSAAVANRQLASGPVTARADGFRTASASGAVTGSTIRLGGNRVSASAAGNVGTLGVVRE